MNDKKPRIYAYLSAEITSLYHEAAVKIGISDTVLNILYVLCEKEGQCLQSDIFRLTGISRQTINSAIRKLEKSELVYLEQRGPKYNGLFDRKRERFFYGKNSPIISNRR